MKKTYEFENLGCAHWQVKWKKKSGNFLMLKV